MDRKKEMQEEMSRFHKIAEKLSGRWRRPCSTIKNWRSGK